MNLSEEEEEQIIKLRLARAEEALSDASMLLARGSLPGTMNRCYYAVFHAASALAIRDGRTFRRHGGLISYLNQQYVKTGRLPKDAGRIFQKTFENRCEADYDDVIRFGPDDVSELLEKAHELVARLKSLLEAS